MIFEFIVFIFRYSDGSVRLRNPNIELMDQDILYHLALGSESHDLVEMFGDIKVRISKTKKSKIKKKQFSDFRLVLIARFIV